MAQPSELTKRVAVALAGLPVALGAIWLGGWVLAALLAAIAALAAREVYRMTGIKYAHALARLGMGGTAAIVLVAAVDPAAGLANPWVGTAQAALLVAASATAIVRRRVDEQPLVAVAVTVFGAFYPALLVFALFLRHLPGLETNLHGALLLFAPVLLTWVSDTAAYFTGRAFGKRKLIPSVSPGKTVAGSLGAVAGTVAAGAGYSLLLAPYPAHAISPLAGAALGLLVSVAAQVGDLAESLFKRDAGVKDSGTLLPGHGGALDRFDSLFFTLPVAYAFLRIVAG